MATAQARVVSMPDEDERNGEKASKWVMRPGQPPIHPGAQHERCYVTPMNRLAVSAAGAVLIALTTTACGSNSESPSTASKPSGGSSATVITPTPSPTAAPPAQPFNVGGYLAGNAKPTFPT